MSTVHRNFESFQFARHCVLLELTLLEVYLNVNVDAYRLEESFCRPTHFLSGLDGTPSWPVGTCVLAGTSGHSLDFGYTLPEDSRWWDGRRTQISDDITAETGSRTFAV